MAVVYNEMHGRKTRTGGRCERLRGCGATEACGAKGMALTLSLKTAPELYRGGRGAAPHSPPPRRRTRISMTTIFEYSVRPSDRLVHNNNTALRKR